MANSLKNSEEEAQRLKVERRLLGKEVLITKGLYKGHWGTITSVESLNSFIVAGGTLGTLEPLIVRDEFVTR